MILTLPLDLTLHFFIKKFFSFTIRTGTIFTSSDLSNRESKDLERLFVCHTNKYMFVCVRVFTQISSHVRTYVRTYKPIKTIEPIQVSHKPKTRPYTLSIPRPRHKCFKRTRFTISVFSYKSSSL